MAKPRVMYFNNDRHSLAYMYEPPMHKEEWESAVDELVGTPVEALMYCLGDGRTVMHDSEVGELLGENQDRWENLVVRRAHQNPKHLIEEGNDPLRITVEHAHANGLLLYPMFIVQFGMSSHPERVSTFRLENRHLEIGASEDIGPDYPGAEYLDFKYREVRDERFALIEETVNKYAVDGFQLNLGPYPYYFHPKEMEEGRKTMTEWVRRVYEVVKKSGPDRELVIDVPMSIEGSFSVGLDVGEWIRQGIVDVLIGAPRLYRGLADYRPLVEAAKGSDCRIHADIGSTVDSDRLGDATIEMMRAEVTNYWAQGVDGVYVSGWVGCWPYDASFYEMMRELPYPHIMAPKDKYYYVPTILGRFGLPDPGPGLTLQLPLDLEVNVPATVDFEISDDLPRWDKVGRVHEVLLRVRIENTTEIERLRFKLNGKELPDSLLRKINEIYWMAAPRYRSGACYWFIFKLDRDLWPQQGHNTLEVTLLNRDLEVVHQINIRDVELETKYLMGKNFHRGFVDPDLGRCKGRSS